MIPVPNLLNRLTRAGEQGIPIDREVQEEIELCQKWGFTFDCREGRAYLVSNDDILIPALIDNETPRISWDQLFVSGYFEIASTNDEALQRSQEAPHGLLIYAERQTAGRGRKGRRWESSDKGSLCFTLLVRPRQPLRFWPLLTHATSVALVQALRELSSTLKAPLRVDIKWPNDVLLSGKKVAGILLETSQGHLSDPAAVIGVGVNVGSQCLSEELGKTATSVSAEAATPVSRRRLLVRFLYHFQLVYNLFEDGRGDEILEQWKSNSSMWDGVPVWIVEGNQSRPGVTCGLSEIGALKIRTPNGNEDTLMAGDVSLRRS